MEGPSEFWQLVQAYVVIAIGILLVIVMFDSKTRRDQENRLALILGNGGCPKAFDSKYINKESHKLRRDVQKSFKRGKDLAKKAAREGMESAFGTTPRFNGDQGFFEGAVADRYYGVKRNCDPQIDCGIVDPQSFTEGYGVYDGTACMPKNRILCNLPKRNNMNYYEGYKVHSYSTIPDSMDMVN